MKGIVTIQLTQGKYTIMDEEDFKWLKKYKWCATKTTNGFYVVRTIKVNKRSVTVSMSREIMKVSKEMEVDHINGNTLDNRRSNLRICTHQQNMWNRKGIGGRSKYKGVRASGNLGRWTACIFGPPKRIHLGSYGSEAEAALAYDKAAKEHFGEFAKLNFPERKIG